MIDLEQAIKKREADLEEFLIRLQIPELTRILADIKTLKDSLEIVRQLGTPPKREVLSKTQEQEALSKIQDAQSTDSVVQSSDNTEKRSPRIVRQKPAYATTSDAVAGILAETGTPLSVEELLKEVEKLGFEPSHKSFRSLLMNDRRRRFEAAEGSLIKLK